MTIDQKIKEVSNKYQKPGHPTFIVSHIEMDELRKSECICRNCYESTTEPPYKNCPAAKEFFQTCQTYDMAVSITRCGVIDKDNELLYKPK